MPVTARLNVRASVEVEAVDVVQDLERAKDLVLDQLDGDVAVATVTALDGVLIRPGRLFGRKRKLGRAL